MILKFLRGINRVNARKRDKSSILFDNSEDALLVEGKRFLYQEEKELLAKELFVKESMKKAEVLKLLFENYQELDLNFKQIDGNHTGFALFSAYSKMIEKYGYDLWILRDLQMRL